MKSLLGQAVDVSRGICGVSSTQRTRAFRRLPRYPAGRKVSCKANDIGAMRNTREQDVKYMYFALYISPLFDPIRPFAGDLWLMLTA